MPSPPPAKDSQDRLRKASEALLQTLNDRTIGAADRSISDLTQRMETRAADGGIELPRLDGGRSAVAALKERTARMGQKANDATDTVEEKAGGIGHKVIRIPGKVGGAVATATGGAAHTLKRAMPGRGREDEPDDSSGGSGGSNPRVTTIIEEIDVGVPVSLAYDQWTEFDSFPSFMKKVENVDAVEDQRIKWKAQIWWSHREWEATILDQRPDQRIVWVSEGTKGHVDGAVTFHEVTPDLTRIIVVLEYHPQGLFERTANIWRAQARRVRAEMQHFRRHVMTHAVLDADHPQGWRGEIEDAEVVAGPDEETDADDEPDTTDQAEEGATADDSEDANDKEEPEGEYGDDETTDEVDAAYEDEEDEDEDEDEDEEDQR